MLNIEEKGAAEDEMVRLNDGLNRHELSKLWEIVKDRVAWGCCNPQGCKESDTT